MSVCTYVRPYRFLKNAEKRLKQPKNIAVVYRTPTVASICPPGPVFAMGRGGGGYWGGRGEKDMILRSAREFSCRYSWQEEDDKSV